MVATKSSIVERVLLSRAVTFTELVSPSQTTPIWTSSLRTSSKSTYFEPTGSSRWKNSGSEPCSTTGAGSSSPAASSAVVSTPTASGSPGECGEREFALSAAWMSSSASASGQLQGPATRKIDAGAAVSSPPGSAAAASSSGVASASSATSASDVTSGSLVTPGSDVSSASAETSVSNAASASPVTSGSEVASASTATSGSD